MGAIVTRTRKIQRARVFTQLSVLVFLNIPFLNARMVCAPVFYCHSCPLASMACPLGVLINFSTLRIIPFVTIGILVLVGTLGGRFVCGWLCPFGFLQDQLRKIRSRKLSIPPQLGYLRYVVLAGLVLAVPFFWPGKPYTFCDFCPSGTLESTIPWAFLGVWNGLTLRFFTRMAILIAVIVLAIFVTRGFCRTLCPLGGFFALFNRFSLFRLGLAYDNCNSCGVCRKLCGIEIDPALRTNDLDCTRCLDCTTVKHIEIGIR